jgi:hypothetical protein
MREPWAHVGRLWTSGEPFLAIDAELRGAWHGYSDDEYQQVVTLGWQVTSVSVGIGRALLVGADGVVRDDSWMEVFESQAGLVAIVQASGPDYREALARALACQAADDQDGGELKVLSGEIAIFSAADDGTGPYSGPWVKARPGPVPAIHGQPSRGADPGLLISALHTGYKLKVRWYTSLDEDTCFARWLLIPLQAGD